MKISYLPEHLIQLVVTGKWKKREYGYRLDIDYERRKSIPKSDWKELHALCAAFGGSGDGDYCKWKFPYNAQVDLELAVNFGYIKNPYWNYCYLPHDIVKELHRFVGQHKTYLMAYPGYCKLFEYLPIDVDMIYLCNEMLFPEASDNFSATNDNISTEFLSKEIGTFNLQVDCVICRAPIIGNKDIEIFNAGLKHLKPKGIICVLGGNDWIEKNHKLNASIDAAYTSYSMIPGFLFDKNSKRKDVCLWKYQKVK